MDQHVTKVRVTGNNVNSAKGFFSSSCLVVAVGSDWWCVVSFHDVDNFGGILGCNGFVVGTSLASGNAELGREVKNDAIDGDFTVLVSNLEKGLSLGWIKVAPVQNGTIRLLQRCCCLVCSETMAGSVKTGPTATQRVLVDTLVHPGFGFYQQFGKG